MKGLPTVKDLNGDGTITPGLAANGQGDFAVLGNTDPKYYGGFANSFSYKSFQLDILLQFTKQMALNAYYENPAISYTTYYPGSNTNAPASILKYPFQYSTLASSPASQAYQNYFALSNQTFSDASYIRLKNVSLSYTLPGQFLKGIGAHKIAVYARAQNLLTFTKYNGIDPETGLNIPPFKTISLGLQGSF